jgi:hypothetical protein
MNDSINTLVHSVFQKNSIDECSVDELHDLAKQYPYFSPIQLLLTEKLKTHDESIYEEQLQKLSLYFNNPLWLDYLLNGYPSEFRTEVEDKKLPTTTENFAEQNQKIEIIPHKLETKSESIEQKNVEVVSGPEHISQITSDEIKKEKTAESLVFEPYHTVDYFASQGIKLTTEEKPSDRFSKQLKSFTEWLKTMKRLPHSEITKTIDLSTEENVQQMAEHSVSQEEVVTETMAEVWVKQGNKEKAIEVYNKLSLSNPAKSHYFAAKIKQLKNS